MRLFARRSGELLYDGRAHSHRLLETTAPRDSERRRTNHNTAKETASTNSESPSLMETKEILCKH